MKTIKLSLLVLLFLLNGCNESKTKNTPKEIVTRVETTEINVTDAIRLHKIPAIFLATKRANLAFQLSGKIDKRLVEIGQRVKTNDVLLSLYNPSLEPVVKANIANLESLKVKILQSKRDLLNLKELRKNNSTSRTNFEHKETELKDLIAKRQSVMAQIDLAKANQQEAFLKAPFDATVVSVSKQEGEFVQAGELIVVLNKLDDLEVEVNINNTLWENLSIGSLVTGEYNGNEVTFVVKELSSTTDVKTHLYKVILQVKTMIQHAVGQEVNVFFNQVYKNVYQLPLEVVVDDGINKPYIFSYKDNKAQKYYISPLYITNGTIVFTTDTEIVYPVVIKGQSKLSKGMRLKQI